EVRRRREDAFPDQRVPFYELPLVPGQCTRLAEDLLRDRELADVMQLGRLPDFRQLGRRDLEPAPDSFGEVGHVGNPTPMSVACRLERANGLDGRAVPLLVEVHAMVGHAQSLPELPRLP